MTTFTRKHSDTKIKIRQGRTWRAPYEIWMDENTPYPLDDTTITGALMLISGGAEINLDTVEIVDSVNGKFNVVFAKETTKLLDPTKNYVFDFNIKNDVSGEVETFDSGVAEIIEEVEDVV